MARRNKENTANGHMEGPRALRPDEHSSALNLLNHALRPNGPHEILKEYPLVLRKENIENMRVIVKNGEVVSHAAVYHSTLLADGLKFKVGGIGSVATHPSHREQGLGRSVMQDCIRLMEGAGCHISVLWTQANDFYRKLGYEAAGSEYLYGLKMTDLLDMSGDCEIEPYSPKSLPDIIRIHDREPMRTERTAEEYKAYFSIPKANTLLAKRGGNVTAYAVMGKGEDFRNCVHEWGGDAGDLLPLMRQFGVTTDCGELIVLAPAYSAEFTRLLQGMRTAKAFEYLAMIKIIDVEGLSSLLHDHVRLRLGRDFNFRRAGPGFRIKLGDEQALLGSEGALARFIFGPDPASSLVRGLPRKTASTLEKVFPIPIFIWGLDSV